MRNTTTRPQLATGNAVVLLALATVDVVAIAAALKALAGLLA